MKLVEQAPVQVGTVTAPAVLVPSAIEQMLKQRQEIQAPKFRTTCTDCVPNF